MPWREICSMDERMRFMAAVLEKKQSMGALCRRFGISRKTGYKWRRRYQTHGPAGLHNRSRAPHVTPWAIDRGQEAAILALRAKHRWGPKKLHAVLSERDPEQKWPAPSTIGELLKRKGLSRPRKRQRHAYPTLSGLTQAQAPNDVWCIDFKGWFRTGNGARCEPLTVTDAFSRYLLCCQVLNRTDYRSCRNEMERLFKQYGLPRVIRSDNGAPFASIGAGGLSRLSIGWVKLGIRPERIEPGKPQQNGSHERMHQTLKAECATPPAANLAAQQCRFDRFRTLFNQQRPHEALGQTPPARHYARSPRPYPQRLEGWEYPPDFAQRSVRTNGCIKWKGNLIFISEALKGERIGLWELDRNCALAYFAEIALGKIDCATRKLKRLRRREELDALARRAALLALHPVPGSSNGQQSVTYVAGRSPILTFPRNKMRGKEIGE